MIMTVACCLFSVMTATYVRSKRTAYDTNVAKFRTSKNDSTNGTVPIVQSQHRSQGKSSSHKLTLIK